MTVTVVFWAAVCFASPPLFVLAGCRPSTRTRFFALWAWAGGGGTATAGLCAAASGSGWLNVAAWGASGLLGLVLWWHSRRKGRRKALRLLGGKARAVLAAMARNMPRPSPRLVPQGARA